MMRRYEQSSSHRLKAVGFRPNYAEGIFMKQYPTDKEITPEHFYLLFDFESDKIRDVLIPAYFPQAVENRKYANAIAN